MGLHYVKTTTLSFQVSPGTHIPHGSQVKQQKPTQNPAIAMTKNPSFRYTPTQFHAYNSPTPQDDVMTRTAPVHVSTMGRTGIAGQ